jgi:hypothetical protein
MSQLHSLFQTQLLQFHTATISIHSVNRLTDFSATSYYSKRLGVELNIPESLLTVNEASGVYPLTLNQSPFVCLSVKDLSTILALADGQVKVLSSLFHYAPSAITCRNGDRSHRISATFVSKFSLV